MNQPEQQREGVLCVGRVYCDLVFTGLSRMPTPGTETFAKGLSLHPGGGAAITAAYLAALGRPAFLGAYLPAAPFDRSVTGPLAALAVDLSLSAPAIGSEPQLTVAMALAEDRAFLTRDSGPAVPALHPSEIRAAGIGHLHIGELKTLVERPDLLDLARDAELTVSLDCGWDDALNVEAGALIAGVDVFLPNEDEMAQLADLGISAGGRLATVIKLGPDGSAVSGSPAVPAEPASVLDTTGAGDAFNGGFLNAWLKGAPMIDCQRQGAACGARAVAHPGGIAGAEVVLRTREAVPAAQ